MRYPLFITLLSVCCACTPNAGTEKYMKPRRNVVDVHARIKEIRIEDPLIGSNPVLHTIGDYLIIEDLTSPEEQIYLFDKNSFKYLRGTAKKGQGPNEIANIGFIGIDEDHGKLYVADNAKLRILSYDLDSLLADPEYTPSVKLNMKENAIPNEYEYFNDTLCLSEIIEPIGYSDFKPYVGKWNMSTGEIVRMKYEHPGIKKKRIQLVASREHGIYLECYSGHDLMSICNLNGELKYNVYGPQWDPEYSNRLHYYCHTVFCGDKILALYSGKNRWNQDPARGVVSNWGTQFLVFDLEGNCLKTLDAGYKVRHFCYDKENNRILMSLDDDIQFAYLDLDGVI
jgi:hypothetical protein